MPAPTPVQNLADDSLRYTVKVNGNGINDAYTVSFIRVHHEVNKISYAEITLSGDAEEDGSSIPFTDSDDFTPGNPIVITAGYGDAGETSLFTGVIVKHGLEANATVGNYNLKLVCKHNAVSMTFGRTEAFFQNKVDSDIISAILSTYGLSSSVTSTSFQNEGFLQKLGTDWDLVLSRAEFNGMLILMDTDTFTIQKPKVSADPVITVGPGEGLMSFQAELSAEKQAPSVKATGWDIKNQKLQEASAAEPSVNAQGSVTAKTLSGKLGQLATTLNSVTPMATDELQSWADGHLLRMRLAAIRGEVVFIGSALPKTGSLIALTGVGKKFNGNAFISAVTHTLEEGKWRTKVRIGLDSKGVNTMNDFSYLPATGQVPGIQGLQVGTVKQLTQDPDSHYRILVTLATNAATASDVWARYANFYGTSSAGSGFWPEIGDEVVVGFLENDPRYPVVLGALYSSVKQPNLPPADENNYIKSITTKSKLVVKFDDENKIISITTPGGNTITLTDQDKAIEVVDQNGNSIKMNNSGITLNSGKDITLSATGNVSISATGKVSISATQNLEASGMNVNLTAQAGFVGKGNATAELSAAGQTTVKGGLVMIN
ncbi:Rhs element Vgr protein [Filimonas lacunae]|uniref:Rhs element Vgr protein n=1 Tax=Filimonas lacunae TaxID=477680 RepID=A0A173MEH0_9BACT|nr:type VI secretion system tip protein VgrG [Filimonas lacunae]BAV05984.1 type VI secretion protein Vgr [Filimonas lacunae]SIT24045.1 Rhs element Vgr protein [Filimonas lacunae]